MANVQTLHERANNALSEGDNEKAIEIYNQIIEQDPKDFIAYSQLMDLYYDIDKLKYYITRANLNIIQGQLEHAVNDCKKAINVNASEVTPHLKLARLYATRKNNLKAIDEFYRVLELDSDDRNSYLDLITLYIQEKSTESALNVAVRAIEHFENNKEFKNLAAKLYFDLGDFSRALEIVENDFLRTKIYLQQEKNIEAKNILDKIEKTNPKKEEKVTYLGLLAQYYYNNKEYDKALEVLDEYIRADKPTPVAFQMRALVYEGIGDEFKAHLNWGYCAKQRDKIEEAIVQFQSAHNLNPKDKMVMIELAHLYEKNDEKYVSIEFWQKVYELDEDKAAAKILADFYYKQGDLRLARKYSGEKEETAEEKKYQEAFEEDEGILNKIMNLFSRK